MTLTLQGRLRRIDACGAGVCIAVLAVGFFSVVRPYLVSESRSRDESAEIAELRQRQAERATEWRSAQQRLRGIEGSIAAMPFKLRPVSMVNTHLAAVVDLAKAAGLTVQDMSPGAAVAGKQFITVPIRLRGTGGFLAATTFLSELHAAYVDTRVTAFALHADIGAVGAPASFTFELTWHAVSADLAGGE